MIRARVESIFRSYFKSSTTLYFLKSIYQKSLTGWPMKMTQVTVNNPELLESSESSLEHVGTLYVSRLCILVLGIATHRDLPEPSCFPRLGVTATESLHWRRYIVGRDRRLGRDGADQPAEEAARVSEAGPRVWPSTPPISSHSGVDTRHRPDRQSSRHSAQGHPGMDWT